MILTKSKLEYFIRSYGKHQLNLEWDMLLLMMEAFMLSRGRVRQIDSALKNHFRYVSAGNYMGQFADNVPDLLN